MYETAKEVSDELYKISQIIRKELKKESKGFYDIFYRRQVKTYHTGKGDDFYDLIKHFQGYRNVLTKIEDTIEELFPFLKSLENSELERDLDEFMLLLDDAEDLLADIAKQKIPLNRLDDFYELTNLMHNKIVDIRVTMQIASGGVQKFDTWQQDKKE